VHRKSQKLVLALISSAAVLVPASAYAASGGHFAANLQPIPHNTTADGGSNVSGHASLTLTGRTLTVNLTASGLTPNEPHAMHIHGLLDRVNECPPSSADVNTGDPIDPSTPQITGTPDGLISLGEGAPFYGPIDVSFTTSGDTSAASGLALERFASADAAGNLSYHRSITVPKDIAKNLTKLHIVLHGTDLPTDADESSLSSLFEATLPVACGSITRN
jgi:hypothetical protein